MARLVTIKRFVLRLGVVMVVIAASGSSLGNPAIANNDNKTLSVSAKTLGVQDVILEHLRAIRDRDAARVFALTADNVHKKYGDDRRFMRMLRFSFWALYNHRDYSLLSATGDEKRMTQAIEVRGPDGKPAVILFQLVRNGVGWQIEGLLALDDDGQPV